MPLERLQKVLARAGLGSRRKAEELIVAGRVHVDGRAVTELGTRVDAHKQRVEVDGRRVEAEHLVYIVLHKPRGVVSTMSDPEGRPTVAELVRAPARVVPVGRLDFHTSGVLLLTNDGDFAAALAHPSKGAMKVYVAKVNGALDDEALERFERPIVIEGRRTQPAVAKRLRIVGGKTWLEVSLKEGRNRQIRRLAEAAGFQLMRLARLDFAGITAEGLRPGAWRYLTADELSNLKKQYGVPRRIVSPPAIERPERGVRRTRPVSAQGREPRRTRAESAKGREPRRTRPVSAQGREPRRPRRG